MVRPNFPEQALRDGRIFWNEWRQERSRRSLLSFSVALVAIFFSASLANTLAGSARFSIAAALALPFFAATLFLVRRRPVSKWLWLLPYATNLVFVTYVFSSTGGANSPVFYLSLVLFFIMGITFQSSLPPFAFFLFVLFYMAFWIGITVLMPAWVKPYDQAQLPFGGGFIALLAIVLMMTFLESEKTLASEVVDRAAHATAAEVQLARLTEIRDAKAALLSHVSHEMLTPLAAVQGFAELIQYGDLSLEEIRKDAASIQHNARRAVAIIRHLLDFTALETDQFSVVEGRTPIRELVRERVASYHHAFTARHLSLQLAIDARFPEFVRTDPAIVARVLDEILDNALAYTKTGGASVICEITDESALKITVNDTGEGMSDELQSRLFEGFTRKMSKATEPTPGAAGLGLTLARRLTRLLGGDLRLEESNPGRGSRFAVLLPMQT